VKGDAVLFSEMTPPEGGEETFNHWYDNHHTPSHVKGVPGFLSAMRYRSTAGPHYLAVYELAGVGTLESEEYRARKLTPDGRTRDMLQSVTGFTRYIGAERFCAVRDHAPEALDAPVIFCVFMSVPMERAGEYEDWFDAEHAPLLLGSAQWLMVRRFDVVDADPGPATHMFLHYLDDAAVLDSDAVRQARATDRYARLAAEPWFQPQFVTYHRRNVRFLNRKGNS